MVEGTASQTTAAMYDTGDSEEDYGDSSDADYGDRKVMEKNRR